MTNPSKKYRNRDIMTDEEIEKMLAKADKIKNLYFQFRVKALIALFKKFGKRRKEVGNLAVEDLTVEDGFLHVKFLLAKKHKGGLFQYIKFLKAQEKPELLNKPLPTLEAEWRLWQNTSDGCRIRKKKDIREKKLALEDKYCKLIMEYIAYLRENYPTAHYLFPSAKYVFGDLVNLDTGKPLSGRHLLRLLKPLNKRVWCHLFREGVGADISRRLGLSITALAEVQNTLDLEKEETAWNYVRRFAVQEIPTEM
jgi:integrase